MSSVESKRHIDRDDPDMKKRKVDDEQDTILREHDTVRQGMDRLLKKTAGLWEENLSLKKEVEFWKNEWRGALASRNKDLASRHEVEKWKTEWTSVRAENVSLKNQVEQLNIECRVAGQARKELEAKVAKLLRTAKLGTKGRNGVPAEMNRRSFGKVKRESVEADQEMKSKGELQGKSKEGLRKAWEVQKHRIEKVLSRKALADLGETREYKKQQNLTDQLKMKRTGWESKRKVDSTIRRRFKRMNWSSVLEGENPKAYLQTCQGVLQRGKSAPHAPFRPQQRVFCPTPSEPSTSSSEPDSEVGGAEIPVPDPDFHDFDASRTEEDILPGQIWAIYDDQDGMPRLYGRISKVTTQPFRACMNWLDERAATDEETMWMNSTGRIIACGDFKMGRSIRIMERVNTFSHFVMNKVVKGVQKIYPRKGQVWAIYKDPEPEFRQGGPRSHWKTQTFEYEMVEILSEFSDTQGLRAVKLVHVKGFSTVFHRQYGVESLRLFHPQEMVRFSHGVPMHRIEDSKADAHAIPRGSVELDPASTPVHLMTNPSD